MLALQQQLTIYGRSCTFTVDTLKHEPFILERFGFPPKLVIKILVKKPKPVSYQEAQPAPVPDQKESDPDEKRAPKRKQRIKYARTYQL
jgi:hypothetical protein